MPKYLFTGSYTTEGVKGLLADGGTGRRSAAQGLVNSIGGKLEAMYFAFGQDDFIVIADLPDNESATALSLRVGATGAIGIRTVPLITPEEVDAAAKKPVDYRPPGA